ncbi:unnamed protein product [Orchesella dallaii]|uniref:Uncharacterized protein n=1 Tax=Orchesella dallaii TaxID=48710 RepID=A0ABP1R2X5_9HEXA
MKYSATAVKKMTGAIHVYIITAPVIVSILLMIITNNVIPSNCFKTMDTVHKLSKHPQLVSYNKVPLLWKPESASKSLATSVALPTSSDYCQPSSSKAISSKCRREQTVRKLKSQENRKRWKTRSKIYEKMNLISALPESPRSLMNLKKLTPDSIHEINTFIKKKRRYCKLHDFNGFPCKKLKFVTWLAKKMENDTTEITPWLEFVKKSENETVGRSLSSKDLSSIKPDYWLEKVVYRLIKSWGDPDDLFTFYKYKDFIKSRELKISLPYEVVLKISPQSSKEHEKKEETSIGRSSNSVGSARIFWDPGFNLKLKLPFFRDELSK